MASKIKLTFLGTSAQIPSVNKNHSAFLLSYKDENILVDCGEGTQRQFRKAKLNLCKITRLLISHWHGDHVLGIPGLLQTLAASDYNKTLYIYGPRGTKKFLDKMFDVFVFSGKINIKVEEVSEGKFFENSDFYLEAGKLYHGVPGFGYSFVVKGQTRISKDKLKKYQISEGRHLKELKEGKDIVYKGKKYSFEELTYREGDKKICFIMDTGFNKSLINFAKDSDLVVSEATYASDNSDMAKQYKHMTSEEAARIAKESNSKKLFLTHLSGRYDLNKKLVLDEAKKIFKNSKLAKDLDFVEI